MFFFGFPRVFLFFWFWIFKNQKKPRKFLVFPLLLDKLISKKPTIPSFFLVFWILALEKPKKPR